MDNLCPLLSAVALHSCLFPCSMHEDERERESHACTLCRLLATGGHCSMLWALRTIMETSSDTSVNRGQLARRCNETLAEPRAEGPQQAM